MQHREKKRKHVDKQQTDMDWEASMYIQQKVQEKKKNGEEQYSKSDWDLYGVIETHKSLHFMKHKE